ncbi:MAG: hypothetical protein M3040_10435 [Bacteroidota bacterium]|nr:hypothetical protein [Bacteroidota bacterium]
MKKLILFISIINCFYSVHSQKRPITENFLNNVGDSVVVKGKIYGGAYLIHVKTKPTFLNLGDTSPNHRLIIRIEPEDRDKFPAAPEKYYLNKVVQVTGKLQEYKGTPMIQLSEPGMIKTATIDTTPGSADNFTSIGPLNTSLATPSVSPATRLLVPDSILQTNWIKSVTEKAIEEKKKNLRIVQKTIDLRTAPFKNAPLIAQLQPGMQISILYTSNKWSYVSIGSVDGFNNVNGFIKHKKFRHLKRVPNK